MKILFIGTSEFAIIPLKKLLEENFNIEAVITQPDKIGGRGKKLIPTPIKTLALENKLKIFQPENINCYQIKNFIKESKIDLGIVISYGQIIKPDIFNLPKFKIINVHPSLLPKYRGPSPIQSSLLNGEEITGVTIIRISEKMDAGDILYQEKLKIDLNDNYFTLSEKLSKLGGNILLEVIRNINSINPKKQNESEATYCKLISKQDGKINWHDNSLTIHNKIRALIKWPVAFTFINGKTLKIYNTKILDNVTDLKPGSIIRLNKKSFAAVCGDSKLLEILKVQLQGKKILVSADFLNGINLKTGDCFN